jgi:hypothetical protein
MMPVGVPPLARVAARGLGQRLGGQGQGISLGKAKEACRAKAAISGSSTITRVLGTLALVAMFAETMVWTLEVTGGRAALNSTRIVWSGVPNSLRTR